jgi:hypothetical protein
LIDIMRPTMKNRSEAAKPEPRDQQASEKQSSAVAPQKQATSGRVPLFGK